MTATENRAGLAKSSAALAFSAGVTAVIGLVYWVLMGRLYPPSEVGAAAAVITAATMLAGFGNLGFGPYFERFLPLAGDGRHSIVTRRLLIAASCGGVLGVVFVFVGPVDEMFLNTTQRVLFPAFVVILSSFALLDHVCVAMYRAHWSAGKNIVHAVLKLAGAVGAAFFIGRTGITGTWVGTALVVSLVVGVLAYRAMRRESAPADALPPRREQLSFMFGNYGIYVVGALTPLMLPMLVISVVGADQNAYFAIAWSLVTAVLVLLAMLTGPYVSAASDPAANVRDLTLRFGAILALVAGSACVGIFLAGPTVLRLAGPGYAEHATGMLRVAALALPLAAVGFLFVAVSRVRRTLVAAMVVQLTAAALLLSLTAWWLPEHGLVAAGWAILVGEGFSAVASSVLLARLARRG